MSAHVTEIALFFMSPTSNVSDSTSPAAQAIDSLLRTAKAEAGLQRAGWGVKVEDPNVAVLWADWDSLTAWRQMQKQEGTYRARRDDLRSFQDASKPVIYFFIHLTYAQHLVTPTTATNKMSAPITELVIWYFPSSIPDEKAMAWSDALNKGTERYIVERGVRSVAMGWSTDRDGDSNGAIVKVKVPKELGMKDGAEEAKVYVGLLGWDSVEQHVSAQGTEEAEKVMPLVMGADVFDMGHVIFKQVV